MHYPLAFKVQDAEDSTDQPRTLALGGAVVVDFGNTNDVAAVFGNNGQVNFDAAGSVMLDGANLYLHGSACLPGMKALSFSERTKRAVKNETTSSLDQLPESAPIFCSGRADLARKTHDAVVLDSENKCANVTGGTLRDLLGGYKPRVVAKWKIIRGTVPATGEGFEIIDDATGKYSADAFPLHLSSRPFGDGGDETSSEGVGGRAQ